MNAPRPSLPDRDEVAKAPMSWLGFLWALFFRQACVDITTVCLLCLIGPRLLLMAPDTAGRFVLPAIESTAAFLFFSLTTTFVVTRRLRSSLEAIRKGGEVPPRAVLEIDSLPARLSLAKLVTSVVFSSSLALPWIASIPYDIDLIASLAALLIAFMSAGAITLRP